MTAELPDPIALPADIGESIAEVLRLRISNASRLLPDNHKVSQCFVSRLVAPDGNLRYQSVWMFAGKIALEVRNPLETTVLHDVVRIADAVDWVRLATRHYDFQETTDESYLELEFTTTDGYSGILYATGHGCRELMDLYRDQFVANYVALGANK